MPEPALTDEIPIDRTNGRVQVLAGRIFFSPNSSRTTVDASPLPDPGEARIDIFAPKLMDNGVKNLFDVEIRQFHNPRWWTLACGWASFVPLRLQLSSPAFYPLRMKPHNLYRQPTDGKYVMPRNLIRIWYSLQEHLRFAICHLQGYYEIAAIRPFLPFAFAFDKPHSDPKILMKAFAKARDWYSIWMGLLSYIISQAETIYERHRSYQYLAKIRWDDYLTSKGLSRGWVDSVKASFVCNYTLETARCGAFIRLRCLQESQPPVDWFYNLGIPVWYLWEQTEAKDKSLLRWAPLPHQLQLGTSLIIMSPVSPAVTKSGATVAQPDITVTNPSTTMSEPEVVVDEPSTRTSPWELFFEQRATENSQRKETCAQRDARLARTRNPATTSAKVFIWTPHHKTGILVRESVPAIFRLDTLDKYGVNQKRYDPYANEWDCSSEFGDDDEDDDDDQYGDDNSEDNSSIDNNSSRQFPIRNSKEGFIEYDGICRDAELEPDLPPPSTDTSHRLEGIQKQETAWLPGPASQAYQPSAHFFELEILDILSIYFGFTPPLPLHDRLDPVTNISRQKNLLKLMGFSVRNSLLEVFNHDHPGVLSGVQYLEQLSTTPTFLASACDIHRDSRKHVAFTPRFAAIEILETDGKTIYMFDFKDQRTVAWNLAMPTAALALMICRLDPTWKERDIVLHLLCTGTPFRTLQPSSTIQRAVPTDADQETLHIPTRPAGYIFTVDDYAAYIDQRSIIHRRRRARAALMRGGYLWRTCVGSVSYETVLAGPSGWSLQPEEMFVVTSSRGLEYIDDNLLDSELNILCGLYRCSTGEGDQIALKSWYPSWSTFEGSGVDYGRWTSINEDLYAIASTNLGQQSTLNKQPCSAKKWRDICRGLGGLRASSKNLETWSKDLIAAARR